MLLNTPVKDLLTMFNAGRERLVDSHESEDKRYCLVLCLRRVEPKINRDVNQLLHQAIKRVDPDYEGLFVQSIYYWNDKQERKGNYSDIIKVMDTVIAYLEKIHVD